MSRCRVAAADAVSHISLGLPIKLFIEHSLCRTRFYFAKWSFKNRLQRWKSWQEMRMWPFLALQQLKRTHRICTEFLIWFALFRYEDTARNFSGTGYMFLYQNAKLRTMRKFKAKTIYQSDQTASTRVSSTIRIWLINLQRKVYTKRVRLCSYKMPWFLACINGIAE